MTMISAFKSRVSQTYRDAVRLFKGHVLRDRMEREAARWFRDHGDETLRLDYPLNAASVVFDCGGYEGDWADAIHARYGCQVYVFEPVAAFLSDIQRRFKDQPAVRSFGYGLHSRNEHTRIFLSANASSTFGQEAASESIALRDVAEVLPALQIDHIDLIKINIEGGEYELLERLLDTGLVRSIDHLQVQFHRFVPGATARRERIRTRLRETHALRYDYDFVWESWSRH
jgi:FkbM family methyltransferase